MKSNIKKLTILLIAIAFILILAGSVNAASEPTVETVNGKDYFFANGTPITIEEATDGALIKWASNSLQVSSDAIIFGGMHNNDTAVNSSITMNGGTVKHIIGGGLHLSNTVTSTVIINGGTMTSASGGGVGAGAGMGQNCGCDGYTVTSTDGKQSDCKVGTANVTINGGIISLVYGGGPSGYTRTDVANVTITAGTVEDVTGGGSNGYTGTANLNITGGNLATVQSVNRGTIDSANMEVTGGTITNLYVCGANAADVTGEITGTVKVEVTGNAKVDTMQSGRNAGALVNTSTSTVVKKENIKIASGTVKDISLLMVNGGATILNKVTIDGTTYIVEEGKTVKDLPEYSSITSKEGYEFLGFIWAQGEWIETDILGDGIELTTVFKQIKNETIIETEVEPEEEQEKDNTPKTGSLDTTINVYGLIALTVVVAFVTIKKYAKK